MTATEFEQCKARVERADSHAQLPVQERTVSIKIFCFSVASLLRSGDFHGFQRESALRTWFEKMSVIGGTCLPFPLDNYLGNFFWRSCANGTSAQAPAAGSGIQIGGSARCHVLPMPSNSNRLHQGPMAKATGEGTVNFPQLCRHLAAFSGVNVQKV